MEKNIFVKSQIIQRAMTTDSAFSCSHLCKLERHGGLLRSGSVTVRIRCGSYRGPCCCKPLAACSAGNQQPSLPMWHQGLAQYVLLVGSYGLPEEDRPQQCPHCRQCARKPHRHSHYERLVITATENITVCIFRFRCPECRYVQSVIPSFLEPYMQPALDLQEALVEAVQQGATVEDVAEMSQALPCGGLDERTISRLVQGWNERLAQLQSGLWAWLLSRNPHVSLPRSSSLWNTLHAAWQELRERIPYLRNIQFLHGLNRLHFSMSVTVHG